MTHLAMELLPSRKVILASCVTLAGDSMPSTDLLISLREKLLDLVSGSDRTQSLNAIGAPDPNPVNGDPAAELHDLLHEVLSSGLTEHGESVDYATLRVGTLYDDFRSCTAKLRTFDPSTLPDRNARLAFWINLYNTLVLDGVIALGVRQSVMERRAGMAFFRQAAYIVAGQRMSCDDIEHGILRANRGHPYYPGKQFRSSDPRLKWVIDPFEARIHFALNCASRSCPPIRAYSPEKLDSQLDLATRSYLASDIQVVPGKNAIYLSSIFKWFGADFGGQIGIIEFILAHLSDQAGLEWLLKERDRISLRYKPYDWSLNGKAQILTQSSQ